MSRPSRKSALLAAVLPVVLLAGSGARLVGQSPSTQATSPPAHWAPAAAAHWAFVVPEKHVPVIDDAWCRDDIDRCVLAGLRTRGRSPSPAADRELLLRRVSLVLTGLPPGPDEIAAFVADGAPDAYERRVDALLSSEACAEHLAVDWLDLARFADTYGYQSDFECRTWPWRDWLIRAFAADMPWDRFVREIVAGDLLPDANQATRTATAFWRLHRQTNEGGSIEEEWRHEYIADRVDTFGSAFLGLTIGCARCHDHKFDPITQRDYYALGSFFAIDESGLLPYSTGATPQPALRLTSPEQDAEIVRRQRAVDAAAATLREAWPKNAALTRPESPPPLAQFHFGTTANGACHDVRSPRVAVVPAGCSVVHDGEHDAVACDGDARIQVPDLPAFTRDDAFTVRLVVMCPDTKARAVLLHTSQYTEDADTQGYQLLIEQGVLCWQVVHHWPGSAIAVRMRTPLPLRRWCDLVATYDGSSTALGLRLFLDGEALDVETVCDNLAGPATVRPLELGGRDRDRGFAGGRIEQFELFDRQLSPAEVALLAGKQPDVRALQDSRGWQLPAVQQARDALRAARRELHGFVEAIPELMVMKQPASAPQRFVLRRGAYDQPDRTQPVTADVPAALGRLGMNGEHDRLALADWLVSAGNPLAARVVVDRLWAMCFGRGLVPTPENFGVRGEPPVQPQLLDALAFDFQQQRSVRGLLRRIVESATFRQQSRCSAELRDADPNNDWLARGPSFRLSAEALRDLALAASGLLDRTVGGPSRRPWQPPGLWSDAGASGGDYRPDTGPDAHRRSLYTFVKRTAPPPDMTVFDAPSRESCVVRRQPTNTPLQSLVLLNDLVFTECAEALASRVRTDLPNASNDAQLQRVFVALAGRTARAAELQALRALLDGCSEAQHALSLVASTVMASDAVVVVR